MKCVFIGGPFASAAGPWPPVDMEPPQIGSLFEKQGEIWAVAEVRYQLTEFGELDCATVTLEVVE